MRRRILAFLLLVIMLTGLVGCGGSESDGSRKKQVTSGPAVSLILDRHDFQPEELPCDVGFTVFCNEKAGESICIKDADGNILCTLDNDGSGELHGTFTLEDAEKTVRVIVATDGTYTCEEVHCYIHKTVTAEEMDVLVSVGDRVGAKLKESGFVDPSAEETFDEVMTILKSDDSVLDCYRDTDSGVIFFETVDHLIGSYGLSLGSDGLSFGFDDPEDAFRDYLDSDDEEYDFSDTYLPALETRTNGRVCLTVPAPDDIVVGSTLPSFEKILDNLVLAWRKHSDLPAKLEKTTSLDAIRQLSDGSFADSGFWMLCTHGNYMSDMTDGSGVMSLFYLGDYTREQLLEAGNYGVEPDNFWGTAKAGDNGQKIPDSPFFCRMVYDITNTSDERIGQVYASRLYIEEALEGKTFDNTVIFLCVCHVLRDDDLADLFLNHGAQAVIGCRKSLDAGLSAVALATICEEWGTNGVPLRNALSSIDSNSYKSYISIIEAFTQRCNEISGSEHTKEEMIKNYSEACRLRPVEWEFRRSPTTTFVMDGDGKLTGHVLTYGKRAKAVPDHRVKLYRWIDHSFVLIDETVTSKDGTYTFKDVNYGLYAVFADDDDLSWCIAEHAEKTTECDPLFVREGIADVVFATRHDGGSMHYLYAYPLDSEDRMFLNEKDDPLFINLAYCGSGPVLTANDNEDVSVRAFLDKEGRLYLEYADCYLDKLTNLRYWIYELRGNELVLIRGVNSSTDEDGMLQYYDNGDIIIRESLRALSAEELTEYFRDFGITFSNYRTIDNISTKDTPPRFATADLPDGGRLLFDSRTITKAPLYREEVLKKYYVPTFQHDPKAVGGSTEKLLDALKKVMGSLTFTASSSSETENKEIYTASDGREVIIMTDAVSGRITKVVLDDSELYNNFGYYDEDVYNISDGMMKQFAAAVNSGALGLTKGQASELLTMDFYSSPLEKGEYYWKRDVKQTFSAAEVWFYAYQHRAGGVSFTYRITITLS